MRAITWAARKVGKGIQKVVPDYLPGLRFATAAAARKGSHIIKPLPEWKMGSTEIVFARGATPKGMRQILRFIARYSLTDRNRMDLLESFNRLGRVFILDDKIIFSRDIFGYENTWLMHGIFAQILSKKQTNWDKKQIKIGTGFDEALYGSNSRYRDIFKHKDVFARLRPKRRDISGLKEDHLVGSIFEVLEKGLNNYTILLTLQKFQPKNMDLGIGMSIYIEGKRLSSAELKDLVEGIRKGEIW